MRDRAVRLTDPMRQATLRWRVGENRTEGGYVFAATRRCQAGVISPSRAPADPAQWLHSTERPPGRAAPTRPQPTTLRTTSPTRPDSEPLPECCRSTETPDLRAATGPGTDGRPLTEVSGTQRSGSDPLTPGLSERLTPPPRTSHHLASRLPVHRPASLTNRAAEDTPSPRARPRRTAAVPEGVEPATLPVRRPRRATSCRGRSGDPRCPTPAVTRPEKRER
jgi:hypothetical protein